MKQLNILLAVDDSEASLHACRLVAGYAGKRSAIRIVLLNVQLPPFRLAPSSDVDQAALEAALLEQGERVLQPGKALLEAKGHHTEQVVRIGPPANTILEMAQRYENCVLVIGSGRLGPLGGYALGSVALHIALVAPCPVVLVRPGVQLPSEAGISLRVTAPVDGSQESVQAVRRLVQCSGWLGRMHVDLVHFRPGLTLAETILPPHDDVLREWGGRQSHAILEVAAKMLAGAGIAHAVHGLIGEPKADIALFASSQGAELIAMGTRRTGVMQHILIGSAALKTSIICNVPIAIMR
ncbi:MAG: universal stress protein [Thiobacillus sp.]|nr:universal stress protein [Thiobacillus sp.]